MSTFVNQPNLPQNTKAVIIGDLYASVLEAALRHIGITCIPMPANPNIQNGIACHADMSVHHMGDSSIFLADYLKSSDISGILSQNGFKMTYSKITQSKGYPNDVSLNICTVGKYIIASKHSDNELIDWYKNQGFKIVYVKQGYCKCSCAVVDENSVITSDIGIAKTCLDVGIDALLIQQGYINLPGYDYGFIGGSCFKISNDKLAFTGVLDAHPDKSPILEFLSKHSITPIFLTEKWIFDIGGAIPILEHDGF